MKIFYIFWKKNPSNPLGAIEEGYSLTDQQIVERKIEKSGCTAVTALIVGQTLYVANIGDTNAVLIRNGDPLVLTVEHNAGKNEKEIKRLQDMGCFIIGGKVAGILSVTRAFGDLELKPYLISDPFIKKTNLTDADDRLIIACDGLWDVVTFQECADIIKSEVEKGNKSAEGIAQHLVKVAMKKKSTDNISVLVIDLNDESTRSTAYNSITELKDE